jgi:TPR repeat protein
MNGKIARALLAALASLPASLGCGFAGGAPYDAQACAENALRNHPDPEILRGAAEQLWTFCQTGDAPSCSTLGVMYELGQGVRPDRARAARLYERACSDGNARACDNLSGLTRPAANAPGQVARAGAGP